jgi:drug/metabolite transporter (DMT)-like permease
MNSPGNLRAILAMVIAMGMFVTSDSCMKLALADAPLGQLMLMRGIASVLICLSLIVALGQAHHLKRMFNGWLVSRGLLEVVANVSFTLGLGFIAIADLVAIAQTAPLFVLLGAWALRGEEPGRMRLTLILLGLAGALLVAQPGGGASSFYAMLAFLCPMAAATRDLITPRAPRDVPPLVATLTLLVVLGAAGGIGTLAFETPRMPDMRETLLMIMAGATAVAGHFLLYVAYRMAAARTVAPFMYTLTIWAVLSSVVLFGDIPNHLAMAGMGLVALAGLAIISLDSRQRGEEARLAAPATPNISLTPD